MVSVCVSFFFPFFFLSLVFFYVKAAFQGLESLMADGGYISGHSLNPLGS